MTKKHVRLGPCDRLTIGTVHYHVGEMEPNGYILFREGGTHLREFRSHDDISEGLKTGGILRDKGYFTESATRIRHSAAVTQLAHLSDEEQADILWKLEWVRSYLKLKTQPGFRRLPAEHLIQVIAPDIEKMEIARTKPRSKHGKPRKKTAGSPKITREPPCRDTLLNWVQKLEKNEYNPLALRDKRHVSSGNFTPRLDPQIYALLASSAERCMYEGAPDVRRLHNDLRERLDLINKDREARREPPLAPPSYDLLLEYVHDLPEFEKYAARKTRAAAERKYRMIGVGLDDTLVRALQRVEMDAWEAHLQVWLQKEGAWNELPPKVKEYLETGRVVVAAAVDYVTGCFLGISVDKTESVNSALNCLRMMTLDKTAFARSLGSWSDWYMSGVAEMVVTDNGAAFIANSFRSAVIDMGTTHEIAVGGVPWLRSTVEYAIRRVARELMSFFTGRTYSNVVELGDYPAEKRASLTADEFVQVLVRWIVDIYHNTPQARLGGKSPKERWDELEQLYGVEPGPDRERARAIFGVRVERVLGPHGIRFMGIPYNSVLLQKHRRTVGDVAVDICIDLEDLGRASVEIGGDLITVPTHRSLDGVTLAEWMATCAEVRRKMRAGQERNQEVIFAALRDIRSIAQNAADRAGFRTRPTPEELDLAEQTVAIAFDMGDIEPDDAGVEDVARHLLARLQRPADIPEPDSAAKRPLAIPQPPEAEGTMPKRWKARMEGDDNV